jgi:hypothetical protein
MRTVRVDRLVVMMRGADGVDPARLGRQLASEVSVQLARQRMPDAARVRLHLPERPGAGDIRGQVSSAIQRINRGRA